VQEPHHAFSTMSAVSSTVRRPAVVVFFQIETVNRTPLTIDAEARKKPREIAQT
jgi:hypothetical protein